MGRSAVAHCTPAVVLSGVVPQSAQVRTGTGSAAGAAPATAAGEATTRATRTPRTALRRHVVAFTPAPRDAVRAPVWGAPGVTGSCTPAGRGWQQESGSGPSRSAAVEAGEVDVGGLAGPAQRGR